MPLHFFRKPPVDCRKILVAHHLLLGDTLMLTPLLAKLRKQYSNATITMVSPKSTVILYQNKPYGVEVLPYDPKDIGTLKQLLKQSDYDLALIPGDNRVSWLAYALGAKWIVAFAGDTPSYKSWFVDQQIPYRESPATWGDMVADLVSGENDQLYDIDQWKAPACQNYSTPDSAYAVLHVGASTALKMWAPEKWMEIANYLKANNVTPIWSGGKGEEKIVTKIDSDQQYTSYAGQLDLSQMWNLLANAKILICPDTGMAHFGRITDTPTVVLFGPGSAVICGKGDFWKNSRYETVFEADIKCRDQNILFRRKLSWVKRCGRTTRSCSHAICMQAITVDMVKQTISQLIPEFSSPNIG
ncbi:MAG: glycosyltransferase family 9 protein [Methylococcales bacterium]|nr:glycosyltransferase family 9 protein [Methylococcales bacterium]